MMKDKIRSMISFIMIILLAVSGVQTAKADEDASDIGQSIPGFIIEYNVLYNYTGNDTVVNIPKGITKIAGGAFADCTDVELINIPDSVVNIENGAFEGTKWYSELKKSNEFIVINGILIDYTGSDTTLDIPNNVKIIGDRFCSKRSDITEVTIPEGVEGISAMAFYGCYNLKKVAFPASLKYLGEYAFSNTSVQNVVLGNNIEGMGNDVFSGFQANWSSLYEKAGTGTQAVVFKGMVKETGLGLDGYPNGMYSHSFWGVPFVIVPKSTNIEETIFNGADYGTYYSNSNNKMGIGGSSENLCELIREATGSKKGILNLMRHSSGTSTTTLPSSVIIDKKTYKIESIHDRAFSVDDYADKFTVINIPEGYISIGEYAFYNNAQLKYITIPKSMTKISANAFKGCKNVTIIGYKDSYALTYAKEYGIKFKELSPSSLFKTIKASSKVTMNKYDFSDSFITIPNGLIRVDEFTGSKNEIILSYKSNNSKIVSANSNGYITANEKGTAIITVTAKLADGAKKTYKITVDVKK